MSSQFNNFINTGNNFTHSEGKKIMTETTDSLTFHSTKHKFNTNLSDF